MNGKGSQHRPEDIGRIIELGEGNGYAQPWESTRKGPSLLAELAEKTGRDINALTPGERIAFHIGWVRGRIKKYEEAGSIDQAELTYARETERFYRDRLRQILEEPPLISPVPSPEPPPVVPPTPSGPTLEPPPEPLPTPEPTPEASPEAPSFSRFLHKILEDPEQKETILKKLAGENGRLWIDKKVKNPDGSERAVRIWLTVQPEDGQSLEDALKDIPNTLRTRIDDLSAGNSWKEKWNTQKNERTRIEAVNLYKQQSDAKEDSAAATAGNIAAQLGLAGTAKDTFIALLQKYVAKEGTKEIWTHVRNAYWHADEWKDISELPKELTWTPPTYEKARIREWNKISDADKAKLTDTIKLHRAGLPTREWSFPSGAVNPNNGFYHLISGTSNLWIRKEHLRISYKYNGDGTKVRPPVFELMAWQVQTEEPKEPPVAPPPDPSPSPKKSPPPASPKKGPAPAPTLVVSPSGSAVDPKTKPAPPTPKPPPVTTLPPAGKKGEPDDAKPAVGAPKTAPPKAAKGPDGKGPAVPPNTAPKESQESAEVLREREVIAIPDIHGEANALLTSLKVSGYIEPKEAKWDGEWHLTEVGKKAHIVFTGDLLDRGSENIGVLEVVKKLRAEGARIEILAGNHEMILLNTLSSSHQSDWLHWIGNGGGSVLKELGEHAHISTNAVTILDVLSYLPHMGKYKKNFAEMPPATASCAKLLGWWKENSSKITRTINDPTDQSIRSALEQASLTDADIAAFGKLQEQAKETFLVQYRGMVESLNLMTIVDDVLYVHASLNEYWIDMLERKGIDGVNREFHTAIKDPKILSDMAGSTGKYGDVVWDRDLQKNLKKKPELVRRLKQLGIRMIVHGHTETNGAQMHNTVDNLHIVNGDVSMYRRPGGAFVRVHGRHHKENGKVEGFVGTSRSPYDETGHTTLASLPPGKEKPTSPVAKPVQP